MSVDLETRIRESYDRLKVDAPVYLLRDEAFDYDGQLPEPGSLTQVFKADIIGIDPDYTRGINLVSWLDLATRPEPSEAGSMFAVSPREVFKLGEMNEIIRDRTDLPRPRPSRLDRQLASKSGKFGSIMSLAMTDVMLERFADDPRDNSGRIINKR